MKTEIMKAYTERFTTDEFYLVSEVKSLLYTTRNTSVSSYQPYMIRPHDSLYRLGCSAKVNNHEVSISLNMKTLKLDFAIQVWEIAQRLTAEHYHQYPKI